MNFLKPISISLSPNTEKDDVLLAFKLLFQLWKWKHDKNYAVARKLSNLNSEIKIGLELRLEEKFKKYLGTKYAVSFNSGRSAFLAILNSLEIAKDSEVLLQVFTCNAAINPILWAGLKPVYVDCDEKTFNIDIDDLKRKITSKTRVVIVQHTFGLPADIDEILEVCQKYNLILVEDCAHSLGAEYSSRAKRENHPAPFLEGAGSSTFQPRCASGKVGTFAKVAFFSFSRDKIISSVYGGMAVTNDENLAKKLRKYQTEIGYPSNFWIFQQLLHPILMNWLILPSYRIVGKYLLILFQWLHILSKAIHWKEKRGRKPDYFPKRLPNALAILALNQFKKLEKFNKHRKEIANFYYKELKKLNSFELPPNPEDRKQTFLRFAIKHLNAHNIIKKSWQKNILIGDWYTTPIAPHDTKLDKMKYILGSCPKAEKLAKQVLNLPTHINISKKQAQKIIDFLKGS